MLRLVSQIGHNWGFHFKAHSKGVMDQITSYLISWFCSFTSVSFSTFWKSQANSDLSLGRVGNIWNSKSSVFPFFSIHSSGLGHSSSMTLPEVFQECKLSAYCCWASWYFIPWMQRLIKLSFHLPEDSSSPEEARNLDKSLQQCNESIGLNLSRNSAGRT